MVARSYQGLSRPQKAFITILQWTCQNRESEATQQSDQCTLHREVRQMYVSRGVWALVILLATIKR